MKLRWSHLCRKLALLCFIRLQTHLDLTHTHTHSHPHSHTSYLTHTLTHSDFLLCLYLVQYLLLSDEMYCWSPRAWYTLKIPILSWRRWFQTPLLEWRERETTDVMISVVTGAAEKWKVDRFEMASGFCRSWNSPHWAARMKWGKNWAETHRTHR